MIRRVARRVDDLKEPVAGAYPLSVRQAVLARRFVSRPPAHIEVRPLGAQGRDARRVIAVIVCDEEPRQRTAGERGAQRVEVGNGADAGVDQRRLGAIEEPRVVAPAGQWPGIACGDERWRVVKRSRPPSSGSEIEEELLRVSGTALRCYDVPRGQGTVRANCQCGGRERLPGLCETFHKQSSGCYSCHVLPSRVPLNGAGRRPACLRPLKSRQSQS